MYTHTVQSKNYLAFPHAYHQQANTHNNGKANRNRKTNTAGEDYEGTLSIYSYLLSLLATCPARHCQHLTLPHLLVFVWVGYCGVGNGATFPLRISLSGCGLLRGVVFSSLCSLTFIVTGSRCNDIFLSPGLLGFLRFFLRRPEPITLFSNCSGLSFPLHAKPFHIVPKEV